MENLNEKSKSKSQQRFMGMVYAKKKGKLDTSKLNPEAKEKIEKAAKSMTKKEVEDFAKTKHEKLPEKVKKENKNVLNFKEFLLEKKSKKEGEETLRSSSYAYTPDKAQSSTWKLRIDDAEHVRSAVAALGKGFRGNKVSIPSADKPAVIAKVRRAYKKYFPDNEVPEILKNK